MFRIGTERPRRVAARGVTIAGLALLIGVPAAASAQDTRVVRDGDTLSAIAESNGLTVRQLVWLNGLENPDLIFPGQVIALAPSDVADEPVVDAGADDAANVATVAADGAATQDALAPADTAAALPPWVDRATIRADLVAAADKWGWDPYLIMALAWQESGWQQDEVSDVGAIGVMQIMPDTAAELDDWLFRRGLDPWNNVWDNVDAGVAFLTSLYQETDDVELAIGSYYQGLGSVERDGFFPETHDYVNNILAMRDLFAAGELP